LAQGCAQTRAEHAPCDHLPSAIMALFEDPEFPRSAAMKGTRREHEWIPASYLLKGQVPAGERMPLFWRIEPSDMMQGEVGNCWLLAGMACLANYPVEIERLFETDSAAASPDGKYAVQLHNSRGKPHHIVIDEFVPTHPWRPHLFIVGYEHMKHVPLFAKPNGEIWPLLLEKAMAKLMGSYAGLHGGSECSAFRALTGCTEQEQWMLDPLRGIWKNMALMKGSMARFMWDRRTLARAQFWNQLQQYCEVHYLMSASIHNGNDGEYARQDGLIENHAYSIIEANAVEGLLMLKLRNPWGRSEWNGEWSNNSLLWHQHSSVARSLDFKPATDGTFWMAFETFSRIFTSICVSHRTMQDGPGRTQIRIWEEEDKKRAFSARHKEQAKPRPSANHQPIGQDRNCAPSTEPAEQPKARPSADQQPVGFCRHGRLQPFRIPRGSFICDECDIPLLPGALLHGCRLCNYDVCSMCLSTRQGPAEQAHDAGSAAAAAVARPMQPAPALPPRPRRLPAHRPARSPSPPRPRQQAVPRAARAASVPPEISRHPERPMVPQATIPQVDELRLRRFWLLEKAAQEQERNTLSRAVAVSMNPIAVA